MMMRVLLLLVVMLQPLAAAAQDVLRGHGGPVRGLAVLPGKGLLVTGGFDHAVILWDIRRSAAIKVLRFHDGAVNAIAALSEDCFASGGEDARIAIWCGLADRPVQVLMGHDGPVASLARVDAERLASGAFDRTVRLWSWRSGAAERTLTGHKGPVTAVAAQPGRNAVVSAGSDGEIRLWPLAPGGASRQSTPAVAISALATAGDGEVIAATGEGRLVMLTGDLTARSEIELEGGPVASLAVSPDGRLIAAAGLKGGVAIIDRAARAITARLTGPGLPVWSLGFDDDSRTLHSGGADRVVRRWDAVAGRPISPIVPEAAEAGADSSERGAVVFRACRACHTLTPDDGNRAGPTLHGIMGRRIATAAGYAFSEPLKRMDIVWSRETIARLFEIGPAAYTPGTKMPEQTITDPADRKALVEWLEKVTR